MNLTVKPERKNINIIASLVPKKMTFEVHPEVTASDAGDNQVGEPVSLENDNSQYLNGSNIGFSLPVPSAVSENFVKMTHQSENSPTEVSYSRISESGNIKYTNVNATHFSTFVLEFVDSIPSENNSSSNSDSNSDSDSDSDDSAMDSIRKATNNTRNNGTWQQDAKGWWFRKNDGSWYYFNTETGDGRSKGSLFMNGMTPDGYEVGADGVWAQ